MKMRSGCFSTRSTCFSCLDFTQGETRMCRITPGEKLACVAFLAPLAMTIPRFLDFSRGKIRYDIVWISPGEKLACVALGVLPRRNSHVSHFSRGETRMILVTDLKLPCPFHVSI